MDTNKSYQKLINHFKEYVDLEDMHICKVISSFEIIRVKKKDYLLRSGEISNHMRFIAEGSLCAYTFDDKGKEVFNQLGFEDWWINDLYSYLHQVPSEMFIQANEDSVVIRISKTELDNLLKEVPPLSEFWRLKIQNAYILLQEKLIGNASFDAFTKYKAFVTKYPNIEQRFPQYMIASYLGITVEYLSNLKKKHLSDFS